MTQKLSDFQITLDENVMAELGKTQSSEAAPAGAGAAAGAGAEAEAGAWRALLRSRVLLARFAACGWCWAATSFVYYGLTINSVALSGDKYANFALNMAMEIVASFFLVMLLERFGRKRSIFVAFLVCGVVCVTPFFVCE